MAYEITATVIGTVADRSQTEHVAAELRSVVARNDALGCVIEIRDLRRGVNLHRSIIYCRDRAGEE